jgi:hypothetical protein
MKKEYSLIVLLSGPIWYLKIAGLYLEDMCAPVWGYIIEGLKTKGV